MKRLIAFITNADLIDPAILRPGRIDRKIKIARPSREGSREIFKIYLSPSLPYDPELVREAGGVPAAKTASSASSCGAEKRRRFSAAI